MDKVRGAGTTAGDLRMTRSCLEQKSGTSKPTPLLAHSQLAANAAYALLVLRKDTSACKLASQTAAHFQGAPNIACAWVAGLAKQPPTAVSLCAPKWRAVCCAARVRDGLCYARGRKQRLLPSRAWIGSGVRVAWIQARRRRLTAAAWAGPRCEQALQPEKSVR